LAVNVYEGMFILDANRYSRDPGGVPRRIDDEIKRETRAAMKRGEKFPEVQRVFDDYRVSKGKGGDGE